MKTKLLFALIILPLLLSFNSDHHYRTFHKEIDKTSVDEVITEIIFPAGRIKIRAEDMDKLFIGDFEISEPQWKPEIDFRDRASKGFLTVESDLKTTEIDFNEEDHCEWYMKLNKDIPNDLTVEMFAGEGKIDLEDAVLERFSFKMKAGDIDINLRNTSVPDFSFRAFAGEATIDLSGEYNNNLYARIKGGIGSLKIILPENTGIIMEISGFLGEVNANGFNKDKHTYTNTAYRNTEHTLYLDISGGIGEVNARMVEY